MSSIVYQMDNRSGSVYAYRSTSYRDPNTGRPRSKKEYLGRVNPKTGEIVPKAGPGRRNRAKLSELEMAANEKELLHVLKYRDDELARLQREVERLSGLVKEVKELRERNAQLETALKNVADAVVGLVPPPTI